MIVSTLSFAMQHILTSSFRFLSPVKRVSGLILSLTPQRNMSIGSKINFNTKHLGKGDPLPPYSGKLRLYNMRYCPYAHRTVLALNAKQLDYEVVNINLVSKPEWLESKSALAKVPALEIEEDVSIYESLVTVEYLDEVYPQRPLLPKDPVKRAFERILVEVAAPIFSIFIKIVKNPDSINEDVIAAYFKSLDFVQRELKNRGTKFLGGSQPTYVDYMIWPWFERLWMLQGYDERVKIDNQKYKLLIEYFDNMFKDPAVEPYLVPQDVFLKFLQSVQSNNGPQYDILIEN